MTYDILLCGVGGQGILSIAAVIGRAALDQGLRLRQSEVHGMAQRGGSVLSHLRLGSGTLYSDLIPRGRADLVLAVEPMEALRHLPFLSSGGALAASTAPVENMPGYPETGPLLRALAGRPGAVLVNARRVAREAGSARMENMVVLGAAAPFLPIEAADLENALAGVFRHKGSAVVEANLAALRYGSAKGRFFTRCRARGAPALSVLALLDHLDAATLDQNAAEGWADVLASPKRREMEAVWKERDDLVLPGGADLPRLVLAAGASALPC